MAEIEYLSWSAFVVRSDAGVRVLIDPWILGNAAAGIDASARSVADLGSCDLILATHAAKDHLGQAFEIMRAGGAMLAGSLDIRILAMEAGIDEARTTFLVPNSPYRFEDVTVIPVEAKHHSASRLANGQWLFGQPLSLFVKLGDDACVFHSGDTAIYGDLALYGELYRPTLALLGIGGIPHPGRQPVVEMSPYEAALAARMMRVAAAIPCHYVQSTSAAREFGAALRELAPQAQALLLAPGDVAGVPRSTR